MAQNRYHQPFGRPHSNADMAVVMVDKVLAVDKSIDFGNFPQGLDAGFDEKRHEPQADAVLFLKGLLVSGAHRHGLTHVDLVEGRQHGRILLGRQEPLGDPAADGTHGLATFGFTTFGGHGSRRLPGLAGRAPFQIEQHIALGHPSARPGAFNRCRV